MYICTCYSNYFDISQHTSFALCQQFTCTFESIPGGCSSNGLSEDELSASLATIQSVALSCNADMKVLRQRPADDGLTAECLVRRKVEEDDFLEVRSVSSQDT